MAKKTGKNGADLATLALAKAIYEGNHYDAKVALEAGANPEAFWIDGKTRLRAMAKKNGPESISNLIEQAVAPDKLKKLPPMSEDKKWWTQNFIAFVVMRGYEFDGETITSDGYSGSPIPSLVSAKAALRMLENSQRDVVDATCKSFGDDGQSIFKISYGPTWKNGRRIAGFSLSFLVDASGWRLVEMFRKAVKEHSQFEWPDPSDPLIARQKNWEGEILTKQIYLKGHHTIDDIIKALRKGASPFWKLDGKTLDARDDESDRALMDALREALGPELGWHVRIVPFLTVAGIRALKSKKALADSTPQAKAPKKTLKSRTDTL
jgi:hypothetical protein